MEMLTEPAHVQQIVDIPVPHESLQDLRPGHSLLRTVEQIVDIPVLGGFRHSRGGPQGFFPGQGSTASSSVDRSSVAEEAFEDVFRTFHRKKKSARVTGQVSAQLGGHVSSSTLSARQMARAGVAAHSSSVATGVAYDVEHFEYHDVRWAYQWDPDRPGYAWFFVDKDDGRWSCPVWRPPWEFLLER